MRRTGTSASPTLAPNGWAPPIFIAGEVRMLDKRAALVPDPEGGLLLIGAGSGWQQADPPAIALGRDTCGRVAWWPSRPTVICMSCRCCSGGRRRPAACSRLRLPPWPLRLASTEPDDMRRVRAYRTDSTEKPSAYFAASSIATRSYPPTAAPTALWRTCGATAWMRPPWTGWATATTMPAIASTSGG